MFGNAPLTRAASNQRWVYRFDLDKRLENAETALEGRLKCHRSRVYAGDRIFLLPSSSEEGRAVAQPEPGWCSSRPVPGTRNV